MPGGSVSVLTELSVATVLGILALALLAVSLFLYTKTRRLTRHLTTLRRNLMEADRLHGEEKKQFAQEQLETERQKESWKTQTKNMGETYKLRLWTHLLDHLTLRPLQREDFKLVSRFVDQNVDVIGRKARDIWMKIEEDPESAEEKLNLLQEHMRRKIGKVSNGEEGLDASTLGDLAEEDAGE